MNKFHALKFIRLGLVLLFFMTPFTTSWSATISGVLKDEATSKPVTRNAYIYLYQWNGSGWSNIDSITITGGTGEKNYAFSNVPVGLYYIYAAGNQYKSEYYNDTIHYAPKEELEILDESDTLVLDKIFLTPHDFIATLTVKPGYETIPVEGGVAKFIASIRSYPPGPITFNAWLSRYNFHSMDGNSYTHESNVGTIKILTAEGDGIKLKKVFKATIPATAPSGYYYIQLHFSSMGNKWEPLGASTGKYSTSVYKQPAPGFNGETPPPPTQPQQQELRIPARLSIDGEVLEWRESR